MEDAMTGYFSKKSLFFVILVFFAAHSTCMFQTNNTEKITLNIKNDENFTHNKNYIEQLWKNQGKSELIAFGYTTDHMSGSPAAATILSIPKKLEQADLDALQTLTLSQPSALQRALQKKLQAEKNITDTAITPTNVPEETPLKIIKIRKDRMQDLSQNTQEAVLAHELGHLIHAHLTKKDTFALNQELRKPKNKARIRHGINAGLLGGALFATKKLYSFYNNIDSNNQSSNVTNACVATAVIACGSYIFHCFAKKMLDNTAHDLSNKIFDYNTNKFSRDCEYEADYFAAENGAAAGLISYFEQSMQQRQTAEYFVYYSQLWRLESHPSMIDRIARLKKFTNQIL